MSWQCQATPKSERPHSNEVHRACPTTPKSLSTTPSSHHHIPVQQNVIESTTSLDPINTQFLHHQNILRNSTTTMPPTPSDPEGSIPIDNTTGGFSVKGGSSSVEKMSTDNTNIKSTKHDTTSRSSLPGYRGATSTTNPSHTLTSETSLLPSSIDKTGSSEDHGGARRKTQPSQQTVVSASQQPQQTSSHLGILSSHLQPASSHQYTTSGGGAVLQTLRDPLHYEELSVIGTGAYGTVYRARDRATDTIVALKKMRFSLTEDGVPMAILREISLLKQLEKFDHPNIVRLLDICHGQRREREMSLYLVFEHVHQDLASYLEKCPPPGLQPERIKDIIWQILSGVDFLHSHRIVHRDLKPQNLLVTRDGIVKLTDFGLARIYEFYTLLTSVVVTLWYRSPEVLMGLSYATPVDIWSCGCIFAELFLRKPLFPGQYEMDQLTKIFDIVGLPSERDWPERAAVTRNNFRESPPRSWADVVPEIDPQAKDLLQKMLCFAPNRRITAHEALDHPYFSEYGYAPLSLSPASTSTNSSRSMRSSDHSSIGLDSSGGSLGGSFLSHDESVGSIGDISSSGKSGS